MKVVGLILIDVVLFQFDCWIFLVVECLVFDFFWVVRTSGGIRSVDLRVDYKSIYANSSTTRMKPAKLLGQHNSVVRTDGNWQE
jgi:hypothetical protein